MKLRIFFAVKVLALAIVVSFLVGSFGSKAEASIFNATLNNRAISTAEFNAGIEADERRIFDLINRERERKGLDNLEWDSDLARMARNFSQRMGRENFFSHEDRDGM